MSVAAAGGPARLSGLKIVHLLGWAGGGGAERRALRIARHLVAVEGASAEVCALTEREGPAVDMFREAGIPWHGFALPWNGSRIARLGRLARLARRLGALRPDVLLSHCTFPNVVAGLAWRFTGASTCIWNEHDVLPAGRAGERLRRLTARRARRVVTFSEVSRDFAASELGVPRERITLVRTGIELPPAKAGRDDWRSRLGLEPDDFAVCMIAGLHRFKDHATLLRAWSVVRRRLARDGPRPVLLLAGPSKGTENELGALAYALELGRSVRFLGEVDDVAGLIGACDAGAFSSRSESAPNAVLECMAGGLSLAATDIPAVRELVGAHGYPLLAPPGDADALADAIVRLAEDRALRETLGRRNRERASAEFPLGAMLAAYADVVVEAAGRG